MLVEALARQIGGSLELEATGGTRVIVTFPLGAPAEDGPGAAASSSLAGRHASGTAAAA
jgi:hypothetical protein